MISWQDAVLITYMTLKTVNFLERVRATQPEEYRYAVAAAFFLNGFLFYCVLTG
jgi:hypothetical protein